MNSRSQTRGKRIEKLQIMVADSELTDIDDWRFEHRAPNRSAAIRRLVYLGIAYCEKHEQEAIELLTTLIHKLDE